MTFRGIACPGGYAGCVHCLRPCRSRDPEGGSAIKKCFFIMLLRSPTERVWAARATPSLPVRVGIAIDSRRIDRYGRKRLRWVVTLRSEKGRYHGVAISPPMSPPRAVCVNAPSRPRKVQVALLIALCALAARTDLTAERLALRTYGVADGLPQEGSQAHRPRFTRLFLVLYATMA